MNSFLLILMSITAILVVYWLVIGQWKYNKMMRPKKQLKAVLFDLDGVIIDSYNAWFNIFNKTRKHFKLPPITKKEFSSKVWGGSIENDVKHYFKGHTKEEVEKFYFNNFDDFKKHTKLNKGVKETLKKIKSKGIKLGVVSNTYKKAVIDILKHLKINFFFDIIIGGDEMQNGKPAPDSLNKAIEKLKITNTEVIYVGDTKNDRGAARNAGVFFIGLKTNGDFTIDEFKALQDLL